MYARVVVDTGVGSSIESLTYEIPDGLAGKVDVGSCVLAPIGSRQAVGYVIGLEEFSPVSKTRPIIADLDSPVKLTQEMLEFARWLSREYVCPLARAVSSVMPSVMHCRLQERIVLNECNEPPDLTYLETMLLDRIQTLIGDSDVRGVGVENIYTKLNRAGAQRQLRRLEAKGVVERRWQLLPPSGKPRVMRGVKAVASFDDAVLQSLSPKQAVVAKLIAELGAAVSFVELAQKHGVSRYAVDCLLKKGIVQTASITIRRAPAYDRLQDSHVTLHAEQENAVRRIDAAIDAGSYKGLLLHGVTASGKTEVYIRCAEHALSLGRTCMVLLPEIAITTQVMNIFKSRFGDRVAVWHSALSAGERCDEWARVQDGEAQVVLGARSAVFAPLKNLGLVVIDEEHDSSYKQDVQPRYNAREAALWRAQQSKAVFVLGSATPSIETYYRAQKQEFELLVMPSRIENRQLPAIHVADLRVGNGKGKVTIFSDALREAIGERLLRKEQVILLQNRRAYSTFLLCRECGLVMRCPNCAVSLKFHLEEKKLSCHHCDFTQPAPSVCPSCGGLKIGRFGIGTERVEEETRNVFPDARVIRMDRDTTSRKGSHASLIGQFRQGNADILVGTQMIAKGLDFPNVTLVGVISADTSLNLPDFRSSERTFQLLSQVAGRSGRGETPGEVIVQTFDPDNYAIQCAVNHDYVGFYEQELENRQELNYPPFACLVNVVCNARSEDAARTRLEEFTSLIRNDCGDTIQIAGPLPAVLAKLRGEYRWHVVLRLDDRDALVSAISRAFDRAPELRRHLAVDVDPVSML